MLTFYAKPEIEQIAASSGAIIRCPAGHETLIRSGNPDSYAAAEVAAEKARAEGSPGLGPLTKEFVQELLHGHIESHGITCSTCAFFADEPE